MENRVHFSYASIDVFSTFSDKDFRLGLNAAQTTLGAVAQQAGARLSLTFAVDAVFERFSATFSR
jgi:hypothetical protein